MYWAPGLKSQVLGSKGHAKARRLVIRSASGESPNI
jgi:hypothetical protein